MKVMRTRPYTPHASISSSLYEICAAIKERASRPGPKPATPLYSSRANAAGPLPMGGGGTPMLSRRNSFTGERTPAEGALSQLAPLPRRSPSPGLLQPPPGSSHSLRAASPGGRPPMLPNSRYTPSPSPSGAAAAVAAAAPPPGSSGGPPQLSLSRPGSTASPAPLGRPRLSRAGSDDGSLVGSFASYGSLLTPAASRPGTGQGPPPPPAAAAAGPGPGRLSRSRSLSSQLAAVPAEPLDEALSLPPPEDALDVAMRRGLGSRLASVSGPGQQGPGAAASPYPYPAPGPGPGALRAPSTASSTVSMPGSPGSVLSYVPMHIPRSPVLAGLGGGRLSRAGSAASSASQRSTAMLITPGPGVGGLGAVGGGVRASDAGSMQMGGIRASDAGSVQMGGIRASDAGSVQMGGIRASDAGSMQLKR
ncbi:hypothetical protein TSOC_010070 [Tetrabaena socialis]|uniref:Uncharacterized protein n=1 Tax=Tetrabaena socialis TaxID=47790 RepID=A0A2J7ZU97_9CHLO|nr:hypothetical protein TSOC_010070 [Tetrabaena socialis]|eukprot:PNH03842.1 hypothetical protein TSOC_010070 [Tetrabaena socialis]